MVEVRVERCVGRASPEGIEQSLLSSVEDTMEGTRDCPRCESQVCFTCLENDLLDICDHRSPALCSVHSVCEDLLALLKAPLSERESLVGPRRLINDDGEDFERVFLTDALSGLDVHLLADEVSLDDEFFLYSSSLILPHVRFRPWGPVLQTQEFASLMLPEVDTRCLEHDDYVLVTPTNIPDPTQRWK